MSGDLMGNSTEEPVSLEVREFQTFLFLTLRLRSPRGRELSQEVGNRSRIITIVTSFKAKREETKE